MIKNNSTPSNKANNRILVRQLMIVLYLVIFILLVAIYLVGYFMDIPAGVFTRDPAAIMNGHPFVGFLSNIGIILWSFTAAICFYSAIFLKISKKNKKANFLFASGLITMILLFDDLFMAHEFLFPHYMKINEIFIYAGYSIIVILYLIVFAKKILKTKYHILLLSFFLFGCSIIADPIVARSGISVLFLVEDGFKIFGIASWFIYFLCTSSSLIPLKTKKYRMKC